METITHSTENLRNNGKDISLSVIPLGRRRRCGSKPDILAALRRRKPVGAGLVLSLLSRKETLLIGRGRLQLRPRVDILGRFRSHGPTAHASGASNIARRLVSPHIARRSESIVGIPTIPPSSAASASIAPITTVPATAQRWLRFAESGALLHDRWVPPGFPFGQGLDSVPVNAGGVGVVLGHDVGLFSDPVLREERVELLVAAGLHFLDLDLGPGVHGDGSDEGDVDAEAAVLAGAL